MKKGGGGADRQMQEIGVAMLVYLKGPHSQYKRGRGDAALTEGRQSECSSCS